MPDQKITSLARRDSTVLMCDNVKTEAEFFRRTYDLLDMATGLIYDILRCLGERMHILDHFQRFFIF